MGKTNAYYLECITKNKYFRLVKEDDDDWGRCQELQYAFGAYAFQEKVSDTWSDIQLAEVVEFPSCCGVGTISYFNATVHSLEKDKYMWPRPEKLDEKLALQCEFGFMDFKYLMYATRNDKDYAPIIRSLKRLGFEEIVKYPKSISMKSPIILLGCLRP